jgi:ABC-type antimicrobial peptide transport system ATPase subunit
MANPPDGCRFAPRCPYVQDRCRAEQPELLEIGVRRTSHVAACHFPLPDVDTGSTGDAPPRAALAEEIS